MKKAVFVVLPVLLALACVDADAQRVRYPFPPISPTPTPTPRPSPSPTPDRVQPCPRITVQPQSAKTVRDGQPVSFGANIAGAMFGGLSEYSSMLLGFQYVVLVAVVYYALAAAGAFWKWRYLEEDVVRSGSNR